MKNAQDWDNLVSMVKSTISNLLLKLSKPLLKNSTQVIIIGHHLMKACSSSHHQGQELAYTMGSD
jgi:hypothetical protein